MYITENDIIEFERRLTAAERERATVAQYVRGVRRLAAYLGGRAADKELLLRYKEQMKARYKPASVNAAIAALNCFFKCMGHHELCLSALRIQKRVFTEPQRELDRAEYDRLTHAAREKGKIRLLRIIETIFRTGIRISELKYVTMESVKSGVMDISCKGKQRRVYLPDALCVRLIKYARAQGIVSGSIFITKNGTPVDRSNIWRELKRLAERAGVARTKVFAHNIRHLFARTYYSRFKDVVRLADILGHSSINTTRIYTMESGAEHRRQLNELCAI